MSLAQQLARALKQIRALEEENAELRCQLVAAQPFVPTYPFPNMTTAQPLTTMINYAKCPKCFWLYPFGTEHTCTSFSIYDPAIGTTTTIQLGESSSIKMNEGDWWNSSWTTR